MSETKECPICKMEAAYSPDFGRSLVFFDCPVCGRFELWRYAEANKFNYNHLSSYLVYNCFPGSDYGEYRYHTVMDKEKLIPPMGTIGGVGEVKMIVMMKLSLC